MLSVCCQECEQLVWADMLLIPVPLVPTWPQSLLLRSGPPHHLGSDIPRPRALFPSDRQLSVMHGFPVAESNKAEASADLSEQGSLKMK